MTHWRPGDPRQRGETAPAGPSKATASPISASVPFREPLPAPGATIHHGKYRGFVEDNKDPLGQGRILPSVPQFSGMLLNWALPCMPYAGPDVGLYLIPPVGSRVWIEFEGGYLDHPIWTGCFWHGQDIPREADLVDKGKDPSQVKLFKTRVFTLRIDDAKKGEVEFVYEDKDAKSPRVSLVLNTKGLEIQCKQGSDVSRLQLEPKKMDSKTEVHTLKATEDLFLKAGGHAEVEATSDLRLKGRRVEAVASSDLRLGANRVEMHGKNATNVKGGSAKVSLQPTGAGVSGPTVSLSGGSIKFGP